MSRSLAGVFVTLLLLTTAGCAASRSEIDGRFDPSTPQGPAAGPVKICFVFRHLTQNRGLDAIPKLRGQGQVQTQNPATWSTLHAAGVTDFEDVFTDALTEIRNLDHYATFTDLPEDASFPERIQLKRELVDEADYVIGITFLRESRFASQFFAGAVSLLTLTIVPVYFGWDYAMTVEVHDRGGTLVGTYSRRASLRDWVQLLLVFAYPFHPRERKLEEIYVEFLHNVFLQIDTEGVLVPPAPER